MLQKSIRKIKVLGYPFAGGQGKTGVEKTPAWMAAQPWFKNMRNVEFEMVPVSCSDANLLVDDSHYEQEGGSSSDGLVYPKNLQNVIQSSYNLKKATSRALRDGYFPVVLGGDHSMAIGSVAGLRSVHPEAKIIWMDAHIDANTPDTSPSGNIHGMPLAYLTGVVPFYRYWKCLNLDTDLCYFGIRSYEEDELEMIRDKGTLVFESQVCKPHNIDNIHRIMNHYFADQVDKKYWVSFDIDCIDQKEFGSTGTAEEHGLSIDFCNKLFKKFLPKSYGMDFTEVNFELAKSMNQMLTDQQTVRELMEAIVDGVNTPILKDDDEWINKTLDINQAKDLAVKQPNFRNYSQN